MRKVILQLGLGGILLLFGSCNMAPEKDMSRSQQDRPEPLYVLSENGDTLPVGTPFSWTGRRIELAQWPQPAFLPARPTTVDGHQPNRFSFRQQMAVALPKVLKTTRLDSAGRTGKTVYKAGNPREISMMPAATPAFPFQGTHRNRHGLSFQFMDVAHGLPNAFVHAVFEDKRGYYWIGSSSGVSRYDGNSFRHYEFPSPAGSRIVSGIRDDKDGNLWFAHGEFGGLTKYDGHRFYLYDQNSGLKSKRIHFATVGTDDDIWLQTEKEFVKFDGTNFIYYSVQVREPELYEFERMTAAGDGSYWIEGKAEVLRLKNDQLTHYPLPGVDPGQLCVPYASDDEGVLWVNAGKATYSIGEDSIRRFSSAYAENHPFGKMIRSRNGASWAENLGGGLSKIQDGGHTVYLPGEGLPNNIVRPLLEDRMGRIWLRSLDFGLLRLDPHTFQHFTLEDIVDLSSISGIAEDRQGNIWLGSHGFGLVRFDGTNFTEFPVFREDKCIVRAIFSDSRGNVWVGTQGQGLYRYDGSGFAHFTLENGLPGMTIMSFAEDKKGHVWIGTALEGLLKFDGEAFTQYKHGGPAGFYTPNTIRSLVVDRQGDLWIASQTGGLRRFDGREFTIYGREQGLSSNSVVSLMEDSRGRIWAGTMDDGVNVREGGSFFSFGQQEGLNSDAIWTISEDNAGNVWLGADNCLNVIRPAELDSLKLQAGIRRELTCYCELDGMQKGEFYANTGIRDTKGRLWWGSARTAMMLDSEADNSTPEVPFVQLEEAGLGQTRIDFRQLLDSLPAGDVPQIGKDRQLDLADIQFSGVAPFQNYPLDLNLPADINSISFRFAAPNVRDLNGARFSYFMEGLDEEWSEPLRENKVDYRSLGPGTYTFRVKAAGEAGVWSETVGYSFRIMPPWWQSWWAWLLWVAMGLGAILAMYRVLLRRRMEKEESRRIREVGELKTRLYTNITHEFRTPLTVIMGMNERIDGHDKARTIIRRNSEHLLHLINQLLDLSKLESGNLKLNQVRADVVHYLRFLTESFYSMASDKGIRLTFYAEVEKLEMDHDVEKLQEIVYNLLSNAIKFTEKDGKIVLHLRREMKKGREQLMMKVSDTGIGIPPEELPHIFDRFYQVDGSRTRKGDGTGIGLALTRELVELMEGTIEVNSAPGKGSEFVVWLPIRQNAPALSESELPEQAYPTRVDTEAAVPEAESEVANADLPILLLVEDNPDVATYIQDLLGQKYTVRVARDGADGIAQAVALIPDIVISDVMMPEKDGYEVCEFLKQDQRTSHIPIVLLTAKANHEDKIEGLKYGADAYLTKPFDQEELMVRLEQLVRLRKELQERYSGRMKDRSGDHPDAGTAEGPVSTDGPEDAFLTKLQETIAVHLQEESFGVSQLADEVGMSQMQIYRKLKALTGRTPSQFIRSQRLQKGKELMMETDMNISEVAYAVGFSDPNYFSRTFHKEFGKPPRDFRNG